jgi:hypothetical protein
MIEIHFLGSITPSGNATCPYATNMDFFCSTLIDPSSIYRSVLTFYVASIPVIFCASLAKPDWYGKCDTS